MSLLKSVQAIVPEAQSLAEAIQISRQEYQKSLTEWDTSDVEKYTWGVERSNTLAKEVILLMKIEKVFYRSFEPKFSSPSGQEATA